MSDKNIKETNLREKNIARDARRLLSMRRFGLGPPLMSRKDIPSPNFLDLTINLNTKRLSLIHSLFKLPLSRVDFINIKSLYDLTINSSRLNLLAGKNSSGKSTVIESIALISKWVNTSNTNYEGVPFGKDFNALSFNDFKSRNSSDEPAIIKFQFDNTTDPSTMGSYGFPENITIGNYNFLLEFNEVNADKEDLKYAPIKNLRIEIDQFENQNELADAMNVDKEDLNFVPVKTVFEVNNQRDSKLLSDIIFSQKIFNNHLENSPSHVIYGGYGNPQDLKNPSYNFDFDYNLCNEISNSLKSIDDKDSIKKNVNINKHLERITSFAYFSTSGTKKPDEKYTKIYGVSFDNTEKSIKHYSKNLNGWLPIKKRILIRWLAMDYIISNTNLKDNIYDINSDSNDELLNLLEIQVIEEISEIYNNEKIKDPLLNDPKEFRNKTEHIRSLVDNLIKDLCLIQSGELIRHYGRDIVPTRLREYSFNSLLDNHEDEEGFGFHPIESWLQGDTNKVNDYFQAKKKNFDKAIDFLLDGSSKKENPLLEIKDHMEEAFELINIITEKSVSDSVDKLNNDDEFALEEIYDNINDHLKKNKNFSFPLMHQWNIEKYKILEYLAEEEHDTSTILVPNFPEFKQDQPDLYEGFLDQEKPTLIPSFFTENINRNLTKSLESTLSKTVFVGPLRERMIKNDDIFSFNYPFLLGKSGQLTGSFLGTFGESYIEFPSTDYFRGDESIITVKTKTYLEHLSDWLRHIGIADEITIYDNDIYVVQDKNKLQLENVGVGVSQVLPVLLSAMINNDNSDISWHGVQQSNEDILLIEQPSLHLHPSAQAQLGDFFIAAALANNKSIFIESHSEHVVNRVKTRKVELEDKYPDSLKVFFASKDESKTNIIEMKIASDGSYDVDNYPDGFFDEAQKEAYLLYEKNINKS